MNGRVSSRLIRFAVFDLVGTLIHPQPSVADVYQRLGRDFGSSLSRDEIQQRFGPALAAADWSDASHLGQRETWRGIVYGVFELPAREALFEALWDYFAAPSAWRLYDDAMPAIDALKQRGIFVAIGSNFDDRVENICEALGLTSAVDRLFWSSSLKCAKPNQRFFRGIEDQVNAQPDELLMVGDSLVNDIQPSRAAGWRATQIDRRDLSSAESADIVSDLRDLVGLV